MRSFKSHRPPQPAPDLSGAARPPVRRTDPALLERAAEQKRRELDGRPPPPKEIGGPEGPEPTRYGDWERKGICVDF